MIQLHVRLEEPIHRRIAEEARRRRLRSSAAFIRKAIDGALDNSDSGSVPALEERLMATLDRMAKELVRLHTAEQANFALIDALARTLLDCVPEPEASGRSRNPARTALRHENLLKMAAQEMQGDAGSRLADLGNPR